MYPSESEILDFIENFKIKSPSILTEIFSYGYCYYFAVMLKERFGGSIYYDTEKVHFALRVGDHLYDITGRITDTNTCWYDWEAYKRNNDVDLIVRTCIYKLDTEY